MRKILNAAVIVIIAGALGFQAYRLNVQRLDLERRVQEAQAATDALTKDRDQVSTDLDYYADVKNLGKATRALDNFRAPDETLFIIVPGKESPLPAPTTP